MTLIVAKRFGNELRLFCDSKVTSESDIRKGLENDVLKTVIVRGDLCIGFAGNIGRALVAIENLDKSLGASPDLEKVLNHLLDIHNEGGGDTDFIVASLSPRASLHRITGGKIEKDVPSCWIGNHNAFSDLQRYSSPIIQIDRPGITEELARTLNSLLTTKMAFTKLLGVGRHRDVANFLIEVGTKEDGFYYEVTTVQQGGTLPFPQVRGIEDIGRASAEAGGYGYSIMTPRQGGIGAIGIYFFEGNFGALFYPVKEEKPIILPNMTKDEFTAAILDRYGLNISEEGFE